MFANFQTDTYTVTFPDNSDGHEQLQRWVKDHGGTVSRHEMTLWGVIADWHAPYRRRLRNLPIANRAISRVDDEALMHLALFEGGPGLTLSLIEYLERLGITYKQGTRDFVIDLIQTDQQHAEHAESERRRREENPPHVPDRLVLYA